MFHVKHIAALSDIMMKTARKSRESAMLAWTLERP